MQESRARQISLMIPAMSHVDWERLQMLPATGTDRFIDRGREVAEPTAALDGALGSRGGGNIDEIPKRRRSPLDPTSGEDGFPVELKAYGVDLCVSE